MNEESVAVSETQKQCSRTMSLISNSVRSTTLNMPIDAEHDFYSAFPKYRRFLKCLKKKTIKGLDELLSKEGISGNVLHNSADDIDDKYDALVEGLDEILERVGGLFDVASGLTSNEKPVIPEQKNTDSVASWNKPLSRKRLSRVVYDTDKWNSPPTKQSSIFRPQLNFDVKVDNSSLPFIPFITQKPNAQIPLSPELIEYNQTGRKMHLKNNEDRCILDYTLSISLALHDVLDQHPYFSELRSLKMCNGLFCVTTPQPPNADANLKYIDSIDGLREIIIHLKECREFAVDLEHHSYRSFLGFTCLMQISSRSRDFIIDTIALRSHLYMLNEVFTDPNILKVLHGADNDVLWLQKDFGLYLVNMFDTGQAARVLNLSFYSLSHLLSSFCNVVADKQYQLADWRRRPLPSELLNYARDDTHYLLYIFDKLRNQLLSISRNSVEDVFQRSREICLRTYSKPVFNVDGALEDLTARTNPLNGSQQETAGRLLLEWREETCRNEDESHAYVLPNHQLLQIAKMLPREPQGILACCNPPSPLVRQHLHRLHQLVAQARDQPNKNQVLRAPIQLMIHNNSTDCPHDESTEKSKLNLFSKNLQAHTLAADNSKLVFFRNSRRNTNSFKLQKCINVIKALDDPLYMYLSSSKSRPPSLAKKWIIMSKEKFESRYKPLAEEPVKSVSVQKAIEDIAKDIKKNEEDTTKSSSLVVIKNLRRKKRIRRKPDISFSTNILKRKPPKEKVRPISSFSYGLSDHPQILDPANPPLPKSLKSDNSKKFKKKKKKSKSIKLQTFLQNGTRSVFFRS